MSNVQAINYLLINLALQQEGDKIVTLLVDSLGVPPMTAWKGRKSFPVLLAGLKKRGYKGKIFHEDLPLADETLMINFEGHLEDLYSVCRKASSEGTDVEPLVRSFEQAKESVGETIAVEGMIDAVKFEFLRDLIATTKVDHKDKDGVKSRKILDGRSFLTAHNTSSSCKRVIAEVGKSPARLAEVMYVLDGYKSEQYWHDLEVLRKAAKSPSTKTETSGDTLKDILENF